MGPGRWKGRLEKQVAERRWHCVSGEPAPDGGLAAGPAALPVAVRAFRRTEQQKGDERQEGGKERERGGAIAEQGQNELIINMTYVYIMQPSYVRR